MSEGRTAKVALKKAATWFTPVACGAGDGLLIDKFSLKPKIEQLPDNCAGQAFVVQQDPGKQTLDGSLEAPLRYDGFDVLLALFMGSTGVPTQDGTTTAYSNDLNLANSNDGLFATIAAYKGYSVHENPSVKITEIQISGEAGKPVQLKATLVGDTQNINTTTGTNNNTTILTVTAPDTQNRVLFRQGSFFVGDASGAALDNTNQIFPGKFTFGYKRKITPNVQANANNNDATYEPTGDGFPEGTLTLEFPEYKAAHDAYMADLLSSNHKMAKISFIGSLIGDTYHREFTILLPHLVITNAAVDIPGPGKIPAPLEFAVLAPPSARAGMTGLLTPFKIHLVNTRATNPLA